MVRSSALNNRLTGRVKNVSVSLRSVECFKLCFLIDWPKIEARSFDLQKSLNLAY